MIYQPIIPEIGPWRFEYKYLIPITKAYQVRNAIQPYVNLDPFSEKADGGKYLVRSIYFDTRFFNLYQEKVDGECDRVKFRIRTYSQEHNENSVFKAEIKVRKGILMEKYSSLINGDKYESFMRDHHWENTDDPVLIEFERYAYMRDLQPQILIQYYREGYLSKDKKPVRITFDHQVSSLSSRSLFPDYSIFREHHKHIVILEVKCKKDQPKWLLEIVKNQGLKIFTSSKFAKGIETSHPAIVNPRWSS